MIWNAFTDAISFNVYMESSFMPASKSGRGISDKFFTSSAFCFFNAVWIFFARFLSFSMHSPNVFRRAAISETEVSARSPASLSTSSA